ncbi:MAG: MFS transporter [Methylacidiphilales bacterium]|nr:MFS transporter [Candidatus Methylacidiphilales bacterium]
MNFQQQLAPFSSRNYRLFFSGQIVSLTGSWMTQTATVWLVYQLTHSAFWLGFVAFSGQLPGLLMGPAAGVWVDRLSRLRLLMATQALSMLQSLGLAWFALSGHASITNLALLSMFQGVINAFDMPARQSLPVLLVEKKEHLGNAIALNVSMFHLARLVGPAIGGFVIAAVGAGYCFLLDGLSYLAVIGALAAMRVAHRPPEKTGAGIWGDFRSGLNYAYGFGPIRRLILLSGCMSLFGLSFAVLTPVYAREYFGGDARTLGFLMSSSAAGSVLAAFYLASRKSIRGLGRVIYSGACLMGLALIAFAFSRILVFSMVCLLLAGMGGILVVASNNTLLQNLVDEDKRGRVMSLFTMAFLGGMPLGSLLTGSIAGHFGSTFATCVNGGTCLVLGFLFYRQLPAFRVEARPALQKAGVIPMIQ